VGDTSVGVNRHRIDSRTGLLCTAALAEQRSQVLCIRCCRLSGMGKLRNRPDRQLLDRNPANYFAGKVANDGPLSYIWRFGNIDPSRRSTSMRILVIGATGTIGRAVVDALAPRHEIVRISRSSTPITVDIS
jgi:hypothetical protein